MKMNNYDYFEIELDYSINEAIVELYNNIEVANYKYSKLNSSPYINESQLYTQTLILNEDIKESVTKFLQNVTTAVSKAWKAFKEKRVKEEIKELIQKSKDKLNDGFKMLMPKEFDLPELKVWQNMYETIVVKDFMSNYETWKQSNALKSEEEFIKSQYPSLVEEGKSIYDVMYSKVFKKVKSNEALNKELFDQYVNYLQNFSAQIEVISKDIDTLNASNKNIEAKLNQIINASATYVGYDILSILSEAPSYYNAQDDNSNNTNTTNNNDENKFRSANPNDNKDDKNEKMAQDRKNIVTYYKASTKVFSTKLKICNKTRSQSEKICKNYINLQLKGNKKENTETKQTETKNEDQNASTTIQK